MRFSLGCLGLFIGMVTAVVWMAVGIQGFGGRPGHRSAGRRRPRRRRRDDLRLAGRAGRPPRRASGRPGFRNADDMEEAVAAARRWPSSSAGRAGLRRHPRHAPSWRRRTRPVGPGGPGRRSGARRRPGGGVRRHRARALTAPVPAEEPAPDPRLALLDSIAADIARHAAQNRRDWRASSLQSDQQVRSRARARAQRRRTRAAASSPGSGTSSTSWASASDGRRST